MPWLPARPSPRSFTTRPPPTAAVQVSAVRGEIAILRKLDHPHILSLRDAVETDTHWVLVTELAHGELYEVLVDDGTLPEAVVASIAKQLVSALAYLHARRIVHRDIKPQNVLVASGGRVMLADMGFAREMSASTIMLSSLKGTPLYLAPEMLLEQRYDASADLWGLGVLLFELAAGKPPFYAASLAALMRVIMEAGERGPTYPATFSPLLADFLSGLLQRDPARRKPLEELARHPFLSGASAGVVDDDAARSAVSAPAPPSRHGARGTTAAAVTASAGDRSGGVSSDEVHKPAPSVPSRPSTADGSVPSSATPTARGFVSDRTPGSAAAAEGALSTAGTPTLAPSLRRRLAGAGGGSTGSGGASRPSSAGTVTASMRDPAR